MDNDFEIVPFDETQAREALAAFGRYGKGIDPQARLNLSDCAAYALARSMALPLRPLAGPVLALIELLEDDWEKLEAERLRRAAAQPSQA